MSQSHDEMIAVIAAHRDGKKVECRWNQNSQWTDRGHERAFIEWKAPANNPPKFNFAVYEYRIAPEPPKPREWWIYPHSRDAMDAAILLKKLFNDNFIQVREVLPSTGEES